MDRKSLRAGLALGLAIAAPALAIESVDAEQIQLRDYLAAPEHKGLEVSASGGLGTIAGGPGNLIGTGPTWGIQVSTLATRGLGLEASYVGARFPVSDARTADGSGVLRNGVNGLAKIYVPAETTLRPWAGLGLGFSHLDPSAGAETLYQEDWVAEVPLALGLDVHLSGAISAGARLGWNVLVGEEFAAVASDDGRGAGASVLNGALHLGGRF